MLHLGLFRIRDDWKQLFRIRNGIVGTVQFVPSAPTDLDKRLAAFLKERRGEMSFAQWSKLTGLPASTLFRLEQCQQSITLSRLSGLLKRLKMKVGDVF